jgi:hypothetical protein
MSELVASPRPVVALLGPSCSQAGLLLLQPNGKREAGGVTGWQIWQCVQIGLSQFPGGYLITE